MLMHDKLRMTTLLALCWLLLGVLPAGAQERLVEVHIDAAAARQLDPGERFLLGVEREALDDFRRLRSRRVALITSELAVDSEGRHTLERFLNNPRFTFTRLAVMETLPGVRLPYFDALISEREGVALFELTPDNFKLHDSFFDGVDLVVFDAPLRGTRHALEWAVLASSHEGAALRGREFMVFDRPLILASGLFEGPTTDAAVVGTRLAWLPLPTLPGMTPGELATMFNGYYGFQASLKVVPMANWTRADGNSWLGREPLESHVGRARLQQFRAVADHPWYTPGYAALQAADELSRWEDWDKTVLDAADPVAVLTLSPATGGADTVAAALRRMQPKGVTVTEDADAGTVTLRAEEPAAIRPVELSLMLRVAGRGESGEDHGGESVSYGASWVLDSLADGAAPAAIVRGWEQQASMKNFLEQRRRALLYEP